MPEKGAHVGRPTTFDPGAERLEGYVVDALRASARDAGIRLRAERRHRDADHMETSAVTEIPSPPGM